MMQLLDWPARFEAIRRDFGFDRASDEASAAELGRSLSEPGFAPDRVWAEVGERLRGRRVLVVGAADRARADVEASDPRDPLIAADGATTAMVEAGRNAVAIVTDLDGDVEAQVQACREGSFVFLHAHGDNRALLRKELPAFRADRVAGTCQVEPPASMRNVGGFTDGDRAVHLALALGARHVSLLGFDFEHGPGRYSGAKDPVTKGRKLAWARRILGDLIATGAPVSFARPAGSRR